MAQNFLDQVLSITGLKFSNTDNKPNPPIYRDDVNTEKNSGEVSSVERYQQKKNADSGLTGTAKYLAKKQQKIDQEMARLTGVDKYLAKKQRAAQEEAKAEVAILAKMTGVEKYLFKLKTNKKTPSNEIVATEEIKIEKQSSVDKYLSKPKHTEPITIKKETQVAPVADEQLKDETVPVEQETKIEKSPEIQVEDEEQAFTETVVEKDRASGIINLVDVVTQCQAATVKGSQCRRKSNLNVVEKTIDNQTYKFAICTQHNNDEFIAFAEFLQKD